MRKLFASRSEDSEQPQSSSIVETAAVTRYQSTAGADSLDEALHGSSAQRLFRAEREKLFGIVSKMRQAADGDTLLNTTVNEVCKNLKADRVVVYRFENREAGIVVAEVRGREWTPMLDEKLPALCFGLDEQPQYFSQPYVELQVGSQSRLTPYQAQLLERFQVKSSLAVPILVDREVWGLLVIHQCARPHRWEDMDINLLYQVVTELTLTLQTVEFRLKLKHQTEYSKTSAQVAARVMDKIRRALDVEAVFRTTTQELLQLLKVDRVAVYQFAPDWSGEFVYEAVGAGWLPLVGPGIKTVWEDTHLQETQGGRYRHNETFAVDDIHQAGHTPCHVEILEQFQIKAYAIAPIFFGGNLWGLLGAYQNSGPRQWEEVEVNCLAQVGAQLGIALKQAEYLEQVTAKTTQLEQAAEQERAIARVVDKIRRSLDVETVFNTTTQEVRQLLQADRVVVYKFKPDWSGTFVAESVASGWNSVLGMGFSASVGNCTSLTSLRPEGMPADSRDVRLAGSKEARSNQGGFSIDDVYAMGFPQAYLDAMEMIGAKAYLMTALFVGNQLWGLLAVYQNAGPRQWKESERKLLAQIGGQFGIALKQAEYIQQLAQTAEQEQTVAKVVDKIRKSLDVEAVFSTTTQEVRQVLQADRVVVYKFEPDWSGTFVAESVASGWSSVLGKGFKAELGNCTSLTSLRPEGMAVDSRDVQLGDQPRSNQGGFFIDDIYAMGFPRDYLDVMEMLGAKAYLMTALFVGNKLWGLLAVYQNSGPRQWTVSDAQLLDKIGAQFSIALQQAAALKQVQAQSQQLAEAAQREKAAKELLQQRAIQMLAAVRPAFLGDLTVRAPITEDEMGTIADAYNNTLQSLRKLVVQVQKGATNVAETSKGSESAIVNLTNQAQYQFQELMNTLEQIQEMAKATAAVTENAQKVELAVQKANETVQAGDTAMNRTVDGILGIRETVAETGKKIKRLSESSQKISRVVNLIGNFTSQTQLLALNASIEATRAGEYGRGFAVVADEVRSLARQSAAATTEIEKLVQEIQRETIDVAAAMEQGIQQVVEGTNLVNETRQTLTAIVAATAEISQLVAGITQAALEQTQQSQSVSQTMSDLAVIATKTSESAVQISTSFQDLLKMAAELQASVGQFKVN